MLAQDPISLIFSPLYELFNFRDSTIRLRTYSAFCVIPSAQLKYFQSPPAQLSIRILNRFQYIRRKCFESSISK